MPETHEKPSFKTLWQRIAARAAEGKNVTLTPATAMQIAAALAAPRQGNDGGDFTFAVEQWSADDSRIEEVMARFRNAFVARAAFKAAVEQRPKNRIYLRNRSQVLEKHEPPQAE